ncbi:MAG: helix-turn-helix domain-containing protein [Blautia faecis]
MICERKCRYEKKRTIQRRNNGKLLLSVKETCELTGLSERTVRTIMAENDFCVRIGRRTLVHRKNSNTGWRNRTLEYFVRTC